MDPLCTTEDGPDFDKVKFAGVLTVVAALEQFSIAGQLPPLYVGVVVPSLFTEA